MSNTNDGGPAFPEREGYVAGMTLRDYFAAKAMQSSIQLSRLSHLAGTEEELIAKWAESLYILADSMLKAREK